MSIPKLGLAVGIGTVAAIIAYLAIDIATRQPNLDLSVGVGVVVGLVGWIVIMLRG